MRAWPRIHFAITLGLLAGAFVLAATPLEDAKCTVEDVTIANAAQLRYIVQELVNTTYFRLFRVNLDSDLCPFWHRNPSGPSCSVAPDAEETCSVQPENILGAPDVGIPWGPTTDGVNRSLSQAQDDIHVAAASDPSDPHFWMDIVQEIPTNAKEYIDLQLNPERNTGFNGSSVWAAIYQENCFQRGASLEAMCYEERVLYRLLSGMHTATNIHVSAVFYAPKRGVRAGWEPKPERFVGQYSGKSEWLENLYFAYVVLLRAAKKASPHLRSLDYGGPGVSEQEALKARLMMNRLLDSSILTSCSAVFDAFDESVMFQDEFHNITTLKRQFKGVFQNISRVLDCVSCEKCKLHGKLSLLGLGTALRVLLLPPHLLSLSREETVAFINTLDKFGRAIHWAGRLADLYNAKAALISPQTSSFSVLGVNPKLDRSVCENDPLLPPFIAAPSPAPAPPPPPPPPQQQQLRSFTLPNTQAATPDQAIARIADLSGKGHLTTSQEDALIDGAITMNPMLYSLLSHYASRPDAFLRHAVRNIDSLGRQSSVAVRTAADVASIPLAVDTDVVIVGSGLAGLTAAVVLFDSGARVTIVEKEGYMGGNTGKASSGVNGVDSDPVKAAALGDSFERFENDIIVGDGESEDFPSETNSSAHVHTLAFKSGQALQWLKERIGVSLDKISRLGGHTAPRTYRPSNGIAGAEMIVGLTRVLTGLQKQSPDRLKILKKTKVEGLLVESSRVVGVTCSNSDSPSFTIRSNAVLVATGGFASDFTSNSLLAQYRPDLVNLPTTNAAGTTGDGHKFSSTAGAQLVDMANVQVHPTGFVDPANPDAKVKTLCAEVLRGLGGIIVDPSGKRFADELGTRDYLVRQMAASDPKGPRIFNLILNNETATLADKHVPWYVSKGLLTRHDTLASAAAALRIPLGALQDTFSAYVASAAAGRDEFGRSYFPHASFSSSPSSGPYYTGLVTPVLHYCMGGLEIDGKGRVLRSHSRGEAGEPIPGLFAAGEVVGGIHGNNRLAGNALTECVVFGRIAAESIQEGLLADTQGLSSPLPTPTVAVTPEASVPQGARVITAAQLAENNGLGGRPLWVSLYGNVYDLTSFADDHPGGRGPIDAVAGKDGTVSFAGVHTQSMLEDFEAIGKSE